MQSEQLATVNEFVRDFGEMQEPDPHISVAWLLGDHRQALQKHITRFGLADVSWEETVDCIRCCVGQRVFKLWSCD